MSRPDPKRLIILRHAKAAWPDVPDHERPLAPRGHRDAPVAGRWLLEHGLLPDHVICSDARRTRETLDLAASSWRAADPGFALDAVTHYTGRAYSAPAPALLDLVRAAPAEARTVLLVGHNPGVHNLVLMLAADDAPGGPAGSFAAAASTAAVNLGSDTADGGAAVSVSSMVSASSQVEGGGRPGPLARAEQGFPTCALAVLRLDGGWRDLEVDGAVLTDFVVPRRDRD